MVTTMGKLPAEWAGVVAAIDVAVTVLTVAAVPPIVTVAPVMNPVPLMVTAVPPPSAPADGATEVGFGAAS